MMDFFSNSFLVSLSHIDVYIMNECCSSHLVLWLKFVIYSSSYLLFHLVVVHHRSTMSTTTRSPHTFTCQGYHLGRMRKYQSLSNDDRVLSQVTCPCIPNHLILLSPATFNWLSIGSTVAEGDKRVDNIM